MNTPNNAAALERLEREMRDQLAKGSLTTNSTWVDRWADELATLRATLAQPDALTSQPSGEAVAWLIDAEYVDAGKVRAMSIGRPLTSHWPPNAVFTPLYTHPSADAPGVAVDDDESMYVIDKLSRLLAEIAVIVNGPEPPLTRWSYHDLPEKVRALKWPAKHCYWGAGEADCPAEIKAPNGELHTLRCKVCGQDNPKGACLTAALAPKPEGGHG